jgi:hypothetical protein
VRRTGRPVKTGHEPGECGRCVERVTKTGRVSTKTRIRKYSMVANNTGLRNVGELENKKRHFNLHSKEK